MINFRKFTPAARGSQKDNYLYIIMSCTGIIGIVVVSIVFLKWKGIPNRKKKGDNVKAVKPTFNGNDPEEIELSVEDLG